MIEFLRVHKAYGHPVLRGVSLRVRTGETMAVVGRSGGGKSVLLKTTIGLITPDAGDVLVDGESVVRADAPTLLRLRRAIGYVFQGAALFDSLTVLENVARGLPDDTLSDLSRRDLLRRVLHALERVNLSDDVVWKRPAELSGGMRKRVGLARALIGEPRILLFDEPVTGLDPVNEAAIHGLIDHLSGGRGVTSILVTHHLDGALRIADRVALLESGRIHFVGTPDELRASSDPLVRAFLNPGLAAALAPMLEVI